MTVFFPEVHQPPKLQHTPEVNVKNKEYIGIS